MNKSPDPITNFETMNPNFHELGIWPRFTNFVCLFYLVQLIEYPILRIPSILGFFTFWEFFPDTSFKLISKYTQKCQYNLLKKKEKTLSIATP